ncbi:MAG: hypothetical protein ACK4NC_00525 [Candidatus Gracilibacteria bacterium]
MPSEIQYLAQEYNLFFLYPYSRLILPILTIYAVVYSYILWRKQHPGERIFNKKQFLIFLKIFAARFQYFLYGMIVIAGSWHIVSFIIGLIIPVNSAISPDSLIASGATLTNSVSQQSTIRGFLPLLGAFEVPEMRILFAELITSMYVNVGIFMTLGVLNKDFYKVAKILFILLSFFLFSIGMLDGAAL